MNILRAIVLLFIGGMVFLYLQRRNAENTTNVPYPASAAPVENDSFVISLGFVHRIGADAPDCFVDCGGLPASSSCEIMLAADYLHRDPGYVPAVSPYNLGPGDAQINCWRPEVDEMSASFEIGISGPETVPVPVRVVNPVSCNPQIPGTVQNTEVV